MGAAGPADRSRRHGAARRPTSTSKPPDRGGTAMLFETGPGNGWIVKPWAARGAASARRVVRDRDLQAAAERHRLLRSSSARDMPGLNFAAIGDSYAYHTARDTAGSAVDQALLRTGENVVETAIALDALDLTRAQRRDADVLRHRQHGGAVVGSGDGVVRRARRPRRGRARLVQDARGRHPPRRARRWILDVVWSLVGVAAVAGGDGRRHVGPARRAHRLSPVVRASQPAVPHAARAGRDRGMARGPHRRAAAAARARAAPPGPRVELYAAGVDPARRRNGGGRRARRLPLDACRCSSPDSGCSPCR